MIYHHGYWYTHSLIHRNILYEVASGESDSEKVEKFPENQNDFNSEGLFKRIVHTKNGDIIKWFDDGNSVYKWDEDLVHGSHYHVISEDGNTRISNADRKLILCQEIKYQNRRKKLWFI